MQGGLNVLMDDALKGWEDWDTRAKRLRNTRTARKLTQAQLAQAAGVAQSDISKLERGDSQSTGRWPQIGLALGVSAVWLTSGNGTPDGQDAIDPLAVPSVGQAVEILATALSAMDEIGRELAAGVLSSIAKRPDQPEGATAMLTALIEHHTVTAPPPISPSPAPGTSRRTKKSAASSRKSGKVILSVMQGGGQKRQLPLALRTVKDPFDQRSATPRELAWYERVKAAPKARETK
jgi:transcriptional regulator with XRE-family HTH domain